MNYNGALSLGAVNVAGQLSLTAAGDIAQIASTAVVVGGNTTLSANGAITLSNTGNAFNGSVGITDIGTGNVALTNNRALALRGVNVAGPLAVTAVGNITQAANTSIIAADVSSFSTTNGSITLGGANKLTGDVSLTNTGTNTTVSLTNNQALSIGNVTVTGPLSMTANGAISQASGGAIVTTGNASFTATNAAITLDQAGNSFGGNLSLTNTGAANNVMPRRMVRRKERIRYFCELIEGSALCRRQQRAHPE